MVVEWGSAWWAVWHRPQHSIWRVREDPGCTLIAADGMTAQRLPVRVYMKTDSPETAGQESREHTTAGAVALMARRAWRGVRGVYAAWRARLTHPSSSFWVHMLQRAHVRRVARVLASLGS